MVNLLKVFISNIFCKLAVWKPDKAASTVTIGYAYDIDDTEE